MNLGFCRPQASAQGLLMISILVECSRTCAEHGAVAHTWPIIRMWPPATLYETKSRHRLMHNTETGSG